MVMAVRGRKEQTLIIVLVSQERVCCSLELNGSIIIAQPIHLILHTAMGYTYTPTENDEINFTYFLYIPTLNHFPLYFVVSILFMCVCVGVMSFSCQRCSTRDPTRFPRASKQCIDRRGKRRSSYLFCRQPRRK